MLILSYNPNQTDQQLLITLKEDVLFSCCPWNNCFSIKYYHNAKLNIDPYHILQNLTWAKFHDDLSANMDLTLEINISPRVDIDFMS